jgi:hypothetical protein
MLRQAPNVVLHMARQTHRTAPPPQGSSQLVSAALAQERPERAPRPGRRKSPRWDKFSPAWMKVAPPPSFGCQGPPGFVRLRNFATPPRNGMQIACGFAEAIRVSPTFRRRLAMRPTSARRPRVRLLSPRRSPVHRAALRACGKRLRAGDNPGHPSARHGAAALRPVPP